jgi:hypothetical protein
MSRYQIFVFTQRKSLIELLRAFASRTARERGVTDPEGARDSKESRAFLRRDQLTVCTSTADVLPLMLAVPL